MSAMLSVNVKRYSSSVFVMFSGNDTFNPTLYCHEDSAPDDENYAMSIELIHQWKKVGVAFFFVEGEWGKRASEYIIGDVFYSKEELDNYTSLGGWEVIRLI